MIRFLLISFLIHAAVFCLLDLNKKNKKQPHFQFSAYFLNSDSKKLPNHFNFNQENQEEKNKIEHQQQNQVDSRFHSKTKNKLNKKNHSNNSKKQNKKNLKSTVENFQNQENNLNNLNNSNIFNDFKQEDKNGFNLESFQMAQLIEKTEVLYPLQSRKNNESGQVVLYLWIDENGKVEQTQIATSSGFKRLDNAAQRAALKWRFLPAQKNGKKVKSRAKLPVLFILKGR